MTIRKSIIMLGIVLAGMGAYAKSSVVQIKGSDTILNASQAIVEEYMKTNKKARIAVTGGGSGVGIASLINKTADIAMASRNIKSSEVEALKKEGINVEEVVLGYDGITVIINHGNHIKNLDKKTLAGIFAGEITNWKELGGDDAKIVVLSRDSSSGTHAYFKEEILRGGDSKSVVEYGQDTLYMPSNQAILQEVAKSKYAIGYIGMGYMNDTVDSLAVDGVKPTFETVADKTYPIAREVFWYVDSARDGVTKEVVDFAVSDKGQEIVKEEGFVPAH
ncbi:MAG: phosphate ABC transporter substrate-binding protein [Fusobacterium sp.]|uniref:phosphate ABC transporter substrate-binding protein n=1 Tax=Fusobacterium sp. SB021 TaxID=2744227 RepID=UPI001DE9A1A0|nr:phosphate ABC transporter substrate-binding protein [Fusobacterium sp.]